MSFLPYASPAPGAWIGSLGASAVVHAGLASLVFFSGAVVFLPVVDFNALDESDVAVSLEILDADIIEEVDPFDPTAIPEDAVELTPDAFEAETLIEESETLAPEEADTLAPEELLAEPEEAPVPLEPEILETAEVLEPEEVPEPAPIEAEEISPVEAPIEPEILPEEDPLIAEPLVEPEPEPAPIPTPLEEAPLIVEDLSPIEETIINPLAEGGGAAPLVPEFIEEPKEDLLALAVPEPELLAPTPVEPPVDGPAPVALPLDEEEALEPEIIAEPEPELAPEIVEEDIAAPEPEVIEEPPAEAAPVRPVLANPTAADQAIGQMIRRIRALPAEGCTLALPRRAGGAANGGLSMIGDTVEVLDDLAERITEGLEPAPVQTRDIVDPRQCSVLDALRQSADYPVSRIGVALSSAQLSSGDTLTARVLGAGGLFLTLLVIDDNGVVQDLAPFTALEGDEPVITVPVARAGPTRATRQLLVALGSAGTPLDLSGVIGELAQDVFSSIPPEQLEATSFAVAAFDVR